MTPSNRSSAKPSGPVVSWLRAALTLWGCLLTSTTAIAHPAHVSLAEMEWNSKARRLEVALRVSSVDLEAVLSASSPVRLRLETAADLDQRIQAYLAQHLQVLPAGKDIPLTIRWIGKELSPKATWLYFEIDVPPGCEHLRIRNTLFQDWQTQVNTINFRDGAHRKSWAFTRTTAEHPLHLPPR